MHPFKLFLLLFICGILSFCGKNAGPKGTLRVYLPDTVLDCRVSIFTFDPFDHNCSDLIFDNYAGEFGRENYSFERISHKLGRQELTNETRKKLSFMWFNMYADGDVLGGVLEVDTLFKDTNWIEITEMDKKFKKIKGKFQAMMVVKSGNRWGDSGTHIFIHGEFNARRRNRD